MHADTFVELLQPIRRLLDQALSHEGLRLIKISLARQNPFSIIVCKHLSKYKNLFNELENEIINKYYNYY